MSRLYDTIREYEAGLIDWHSAREELLGFGIDGDDLARAIGPCPEHEKCHYGEVEDTA